MTAGRLTPTLSGRARTAGGRSSSHYFAAEEVERYRVYRDGTIQRRNWRNADSQVIAATARWQDVNNRVATGIDRQAEAIAGGCQFFAPEGVFVLWRREPRGRAVEYRTAAIGTFLDHAAGWRAALRVARNGERHGWSETPLGSAASVPWRVGARV